MKVLVNCYACSPYKGSEPGMGWNFVRGLANENELHIITESKFKDDLEKYFANYPSEKKNLHFYFIRKERHKKLRKIWPPSYYWFYNQWQKKALILAQELDQKENFDIIHQLNMIGYREPGYLFKIDKPFVWGPIDGFNITPLRLLPTLGLKGALFYGMRNIINFWQMRYSSRCKKAARRSSTIIAATLDAQKAIRRFWNRSSIIIPEVGFKNERNFNLRQRENVLRLCWSGIHTPRKSLNFLIEALSQLPPKTNVELHVLGIGECTRKWQEQANKHHLQNIYWHGWVEKNKAERIMEECHCFIITSLSDASSTVLLEALSKGLPVIATNHLGFANIVTEKCGIKIDVRSHQQIVEDLAQSITLLERDETLRQKLSKGAYERAKDFTWENKAEQINQIYQKAVNTYKSETRA